MKYEVCSLQAASTTKIFKESSYWSILVFDLNKTAFFISVLQQAT